MMYMVEQLAINLLDYCIDDYKPERWEIVGLISTDHGDSYNIKITNFEHDVYNFPVNVYIMIDHEKKEILLDVYHKLDCISKLYIPNKFYHSFRQTIMKILKTKENLSK